MAVARGLIRDRLRADPERSKWNSGGLVAGPFRRSVSTEPRRSSNQFGWLVCGSFSFLFRRQSGHPQPNSLRRD